MSMHGPASKLANNQHQIQPNLFQLRDGDINKGIKCYVFFFDSVYIGEAHMFTAYSFNLHYDCCCNVTGTEI